MHEEHSREPCALAEEAAMADGEEPAASSAPRRFRARQGEYNAQDVVIEQRIPGWWDDEGDPRYDATVLPLAEAEEFLREFQAAVDAARGVRADRWWHS